mmetsp:Transcript_41689/g.88827  ORF Transcript_41689/g.88827 Transcript_41689/m.88827 type:complete len:133 (-) Transcript_41689:171-569(-)
MLSLDNILLSYGSLPPQSRKSLVALAAYDLECKPTRDVARLAAALALLLQRRRRRRQQLAPLPPTLPTELPEDNGEKNAQFIGRAEENAPTTLQARSPGGSAITDGSAAVTPKRARIATIERANAAGGERRS